MNFILKLAYLYKVTEKKRLIYMHLLSLFIVLCGLPGPQERSNRFFQDLEFSVVYLYLEEKTCVHAYNYYCYHIIVIYGSVLWLTRPSRQR